jgi:hypothetical protein
MVPGGQLVLKLPLLTIEKSALPPEEDNIKSAKRFPG